MHKHKAKGKRKKHHKPVSRRFNKRIFGVSLASGVVIAASIFFFKHWELTHTSGIRETNVRPKIMKMEMRLKPESIPTKKLVEILFSVPYKGDFDGAYKLAREKAGKHLKTEIKGISRRGIKEDERYYFLAPYCVQHTRISVKADPRLLVLAEIISKGDYGKEGIKRLSNWVNQNIVYNNSLPPLTSPELILRRGKGECYERAILLTSMLKMLGIKADGIFISFSRSNKVFKGGHITVRVHINGKSAIVDPSFEPAQYFDSWGSYFKSLYFRVLVKNLKVESFDAVSLTKWVEPNDIPENIRKLLDEKESIGSKAFEGKAEMYNKFIDKKLAEGIHQVKQLGVLEKKGESETIDVILDYCPSIKMATTLQGLAKGFR